MTDPTEVQNKSTSLRGKYHLSGKFLKISAPLYLVALVLFAYGRDIFGSDFNEPFRVLTFGICMVFAGILLAANLSIWQKSKYDN